jgi:hypothetical protein
VVPQVNVSPRSQRIAGAAFGFLFSLSHSRGVLYLREAGHQCCSALHGIV